MKSYEFSKTYIGKDAQDFYAKVLLTGNAKKTLHYYGNVKDSIILSTFDKSFEKPLTVTPYEIDLSFCLETLSTSYLAEVTQMSFEEYFLNYVSKKVSDDLENLIWKDFLEMFKKDERVLKVNTPVVDLFKKETFITQDGAIINADSRNLYFGTDLLDDFNLKVFPELSIEGNSTLRVIGNLKYGVQYGISEEIVYCYN